MRNRKIFIPIIALCLIALILGTFFDVAISNNIALVNNKFSLIVASVAENPAYGGIGILSGIIFSAAVKNKKSTFFVLILHGFATCASLLAIYFQGEAFVCPNGWGGLYPEINKLYFKILFGCILVVPWNVLGYFLGKKVNNVNKIYIAVTVVTTIGLLIVFSLLVKGIFHRPRYRYLLGTDNFDLFHMWFVPFNGEEYKLLKEESELYEANSTYYEAFKSFPSGHSMYSSSLMLVLGTLPYFIPSFKKKQTLLVYIGFAWGIFVAFSRILCGAHFLSDVAVGILITIIFTIISNEVILHYFDKENMLANE